MPLMPLPQLLLPPPLLRLPKKRSNFLLGFTRGPARLWQALFA
jgi:hypothetical protein